MFAVPVSPVKILSPSVKEIFIKVGEKAKFILENIEVYSDEKIEKANDKEAEIDKIIEKIDRYAKPEDLIRVYRLNQNVVTQIYGEKLENENEMYYFF